MLWLSVRATFVDGACVSVSELVSSLPEDLAEALDRADLAVTMPAGRQPRGDAGDETPFGEPRILVFPGWTPTMATYRRIAAWRCP